MKGGGNKDERWRAQGCMGAGDWLKEQRCLVARAKLKSGENAAMKWISMCFVVEAGKVSVRSEHRLRFE